MEKNNFKRILFISALIIVGLTTVFGNYSPITVILLLFVPVLWWYVRRDRIALGLTRKNIQNAFLYLICPNGCLAKKEINNVLFNFCLIL